MLRLLIITTLCLIAAAWDEDGTTCNKIGQTIHGCHCYRDYKEDNITLVYEIRCSHLRTLDELKELLDIAKEGKNLHIIFYDLTVKEIPSDLFQGQHFESLQFEYCKIVSFGDKPFQGLEDSLKRLGFVNTRERKNVFDNATFSHLKSLEHLLVNYDVYLTEIPDTWFNGEPSNLITIDLESNAIGILGDNAFASLENLEYIWFYQNRIVTLKRSMFPKPANHLKNIDLGYNTIGDLPSDLFSDMPSLRRINVNDNGLRTMDQATWEEPLTKNNASIDIRDNPLICDKKLLWIYEKDLQHDIHGHCYMERTGKWSAMHVLTLKDFESD